MDPPPRDGSLGNREGLLDEAARMVADKDRLLELLRVTERDLAGTASMVPLPPCELMVVGDLHGNAAAAAWLVHAASERPDAHVVMLGDYCDRGDEQLLTLAIVLLLRIRSPSRFTLLRGNHEDRAMASIYGLADEVLATHDTEVLDAVYAMFAQLPLSAHRLDGVLCVHGGLPSSASVLSDISSLPKGRDASEDPDVLELLWNDPEERPGGFSGNLARGRGMTFGLDASKEFMDRTGLWLLARGHQCVPEGTAWLHTGRVLSVFSHPGYAGRGNNGAVALVGMDRQVNRRVIEARDAM